MYKCAAVQHGLEPEIVGAAPPPEKRVCGREFVHYQTRITTF